MIKKLFSNKTLLIIYLLVVTLVCGLWTSTIHKVDASSSSVITNEDGFEMVNEVNLRFDGDGLSFEVKIDQSTFDLINNGSELHFALIPQNNIDAFIQVVEDGTFDMEKYSVTKKCYLDIPVSADKISLEGDYYFAKAGVSSVSANHKDLNYLAWAYYVTDGNYTFAKFYDGDYNKSMSNQYSELNYWIANSNKASELLTQYAWFGSEDYPITVDSVEDYKTLVTVIESNATLFTGKAFSVDSEITNEIAKDSTYFDEHSDTITLVSKIERQYTVTFKDVDGTVIKSEKFDYGTIPSYQGAIYVEGWDKEIVAVTEETTYTATSSIEYEYNGSNAYVVKNGKNWTLSSVTIPLVYNDGTHNEHPVISIGNGAFSQNQNITHVYLSDNVTKIYGGAFHTCSNLEFIDLGNVEDFGAAIEYETMQNSFHACNKLKTVMVNKDLSVLNAVFNRATTTEPVYFSIYAKKAGGTITVDTRPSDGKPTRNHLWDGKVFVKDEELSTCNTWKWDNDEIKTKSHDVGNHGYCNNCFEKLKATAAVDYTYDASIGGYVASAKGTFNQAKLYIADYFNDGTHDKKEVKKIGASIFDSASTSTVGSVLTHVYLPDTITTIGSCAFRNCTNIVLVKMSKNISTIEANAFQSCHGLTAMIIQKSLECTTGAFNGGGAWEKAKMNIYALEEGGTVNITANTKPLFTGNVFVKDDNLSACNTWKWNATGDGVVTKLHDEGLHGYCNNCFEKLNKVAAVDYTYDASIGGYVASAKGTFNQAKLYIADYFNDGTHDKKEVKKIGASIFDSAITSTVGSMLTHVYLPDTITTIGSCAFRNCTNIVLVKMSKNISTIEANAFQSCHGLTAMIIQKSLECTTGAFNGGGAWVSAKMNIYALEEGGTVNITANTKPLFTGKVYVQGVDWDGYNENGIPKLIQG